MLRAQKDGTIGVEAASRLSPEELGDKIVRGVLVDREAPEYTAQYARIIEMARSRL